MSFMGSVSVTNMVTCQPASSPVWRLPDCRHFGDNSGMAKKIRNAPRRKLEKDSFLKAARTGMKLSLQALADLVGTSRQQMQRLEKGKRGLSREWAIRIAPHVEKSPEFLMFGPRTAEVAGYVGGGAEVYAMDDHEPGAGLEDVEIPPGVPENAVLVIVRGDSMYPRYFDGEYLFYVRAGHSPRELVGRECVVKLVDGRTFVKVLRPGADEQTFNLESWNSNTATIEDVIVEWAAPVVARVNKQRRAA